MAVEVARLNDGYTNNFKLPVEPAEPYPAGHPSDKAPLEIEAVAMRLTTEVIRETLAQPTPPDKA